MHSTQRTLPVTCFVNVSRMSSAVETAFAAKGGFGQYGG
jgi:hypothetical protein